MNLIFQKKEFRLEVFCKTPKPDSISEKGLCRAQQSGCQIRLAQKKTEPGTGGKETDERTGGGKQAALFSRTNTKGKLRPLLPSACLSFLQRQSSKVFGSVGFVMPYKKGRQPQNSLGQVFHEKLQHLAVLLRETVHYGVDLGHPRLGIVKF